MRLPVGYSRLGSRRCQNVFMCYMLKLQSCYMQQVIRLQKVFRLMCVTTRGTGRETRDDNGNAEGVPHGFFFETQLLELQLPSRWSE